jgi:hypothetical protein
LVSLRRANKEKLAIFIDRIVFRVLWLVRL